MISHSLFLETLREMSLLDLLRVYVEAKTGEYIELEEELSTETLDLIRELEDNLNELL